MIQEDRPVRDPAKQVEPEVASFVRQDCIDFHGCRFEPMLSRRSSGRRGCRPRDRPRMSQRSIMTIPVGKNLTTRAWNHRSNPERGLHTILAPFPAPPCRIFHGNPIIMTARIFKPAKNAMQSGTAITKEWRLDYEPEQPRVIEPLMGWRSFGDMQQE